MAYIILIIFVISLYLVTLRKEEITKSQNIMSYNTDEIANYFLEKGKDDEQMTPMKLIKLVYIAHGWNLGLTGQPLVAEDAEAWKYGPVFPSLYKKYREFKDRKIKYKTVELKITDSNDLDFLDRVWNFYKNFNGLQLSTKTHEPNTPWSLTWENAIKNDVISEKSLIIPNDIIAKHYSNLSPSK